MKSKKKKFSASLLLSALLVSSFAVQAAAPLDPAQADAKRQEAVSLARQHQFDKALPLLEELAAAGDTDRLFWADYLTVLSWKGDDAKIIQLVDRHFPQGIAALPDYALVPVAKAYDHLGETEKGQQVYELLKNRGENDNSAQKQADALVEQAYDAMNRKDYVEGETYFSQAKNVLAAQPQAVENLDARRAAFYIHSGEPGRSVRILKPYVENGKASPAMFSDYLQALREDNQTKQAKQAFKDYGEKWRTLPSYGLQTMGDLYLRERDFKQAHRIYDVINQRGDKLPYVQLGDAYCQAMLGRKKEALALYQEVLRENKYSPRLEKAIAYDVAAYLQSGDLTMARRTNDLLGKDAAEKEYYQLQYGLALVNANGDLNNSLLNFRRDMLLDGRDYSHEARRVLTPLTQSKNEDIRLTAQTALVKNTVDQGRYGSADKQLQALLETDNDDPAVLNAGLQNDTRQEHSLSTYYSGRLDNKRNHISDLGFSYSDYLSGNVYLSSGWEHRGLQDGHLKTSYNREDLGALWYLPWGSVSASYDYYGSKWKNGYIASVSYEFDDLSSLDFSVGRRPHDAAGAAKRHITEDYKEVSWNFIPAPRWTLGLSYEWADLSDENRYWSAGLNGKYSLSQKHNYYDALLFDFGRSHYRDRSDYYDSPYRSNYYDLGWQRRWYIQSRDRYWLWTTMFGGGHDNDEREGFSPSTRLELIQDLPHSQRIRVAAQYNWYFHQDPDAAWQRRRNGYLFEVSYGIGW